MYIYYFLFNKSNGLLVLLKNNDCVTFIIYYYNIIAIYDNNVLIYSFLESATSCIFQYLRTKLVKLIQLTYTNKVD